MLRGRLFMDTVKLVIWDMDDTFWEGVISEGKVTPITKNINLLKALSERGIVNSICSKNDYEVVKEELIKQGVWDYFVFASIDWSPKGGRVEKIIDDMNLRPCNVIFVDDNPTNLEEVKSIVKDINVFLPEEFMKIAEIDEHFEGKNDKELSRLKQYKILEKKTVDKNKASSNEKFLFDSDIQVIIDYKVDNQLDRIYEMIHRNNQLNFTKNKISRDEVRDIFMNPSIKCGVVKCIDKYGDHGLIGCFAIKEDTALQFVFSCRILGMGVEQFVYSFLGYPKIEIKEPVAVKLKKDFSPKWINQKCLDSSNENGKKIDGFVNDGLIAYGTCPLRPIWAYLEPKLENAKFAEMDPGPSILNLAVTLRISEDEKQYLLNNIKFFDTRYTFDSDLFSPETKYILISLDSEMNTLKYTSTQDDRSVFYLRKILTEKNTNNSILHEYRGSRVSFEDIEYELRYLLANISNEKKVLLVTVPEVAFPSEGENKDFLSRKRLNSIAEKLADEYTNLDLIDIRKYATHTSDFFDTTSNHYNREIGAFLARDILEIMHGCSHNPSDIEPKKNNEENYPTNTVIDEINVAHFGNATYKYYIRNGYAYLNIHMSEPASYMYKYMLMRNRYIEYQTEWNEKNTLSLPLSKLGSWRIRIRIKKNI